MKWEVIIGLEIHVQLATKSKIFSDSITLFGSDPNTQIAFVDLALPGSLPTVNKYAIELAIRFGLAIGATIQKNSVFERKHYFYPDLPKGYQISQFQNPILQNGTISFICDEQVKTVKLERAHLEEDAGKSIHNEYFLKSNNNLPGTGIDLNRAGLPLLEIVTKPDIRSASEAVSFAKALHNLVMWLNICDGNMEKGSFRFDLNISVRLKGTKKLGVRTEIKNLNSFRFLERAIVFETNRQIKSITSGNQLIQETRLYNPERNQTYSMRNKENAYDYLYFPDPDLPKINIPEKWIDQVKLTIPELPISKFLLFESNYALSRYEASQLTSNYLITNYFESTIKLLPKGNENLCAKWILNEIPTILNSDKYDLLNSCISSQNLANLILKIIDGTISNQIARKIFKIMWTGEYNCNVDLIIKAYNLQQINNLEIINPILDKVLSNNASIVEDYILGKKKVFNSLVGKAMKETKGKVNPQTIQKSIKEKLESLINNKKIL
ncbi:MAG: Asp-tRNA(Asn)/Glu-tRNA(Gln) amidotransferase subunit GatB [Bordetella sp.]|nr:MAG: Asp-tRNA(Asn)/Glu-tRNA(Gln) amidotransferase subunit GatB [Bordetella sp.]